MADEGQGDTSQQQDTKPLAAEHINLKVKGQHGAEVYFKVKKTTQLRKLMDAYCQRIGADIKNVRFLLDGTRLNAEQTPKDVGLENDDVIDAMVEQTGGH